MGRVRLDTHGQAGAVVLLIGTKGFRSDTGLTPDDYRSDAWKNVTRGGEPFNLPTDIDVALSGEMFVTDGYGNARVHKFAADGTHLFSWGDPSFRSCHGIWGDSRGDLYVVRAGPWGRRRRVVKHVRVSTAGSEPGRT